MTLKENKNLFISNNTLKSFQNHQQSRGGGDDFTGTMFLLFNRNF